MSKTTLLRKALQYEADNHAAALVVMNDPRYQGGALEEWARLVLAKADAANVRKRPGRSSATKRVASAG
jgi:hypothetical protein